MKILNKREPQNIPSNYLADINYKGFMKIYRKFKTSFLDPL